MNLIACLVACFLTQSTKRAGWHMELLSRSGGYASQVTFSPNGLYLATSEEQSTSDGQPRGVAVLWDVKSRKVIRKMRSDANWIYSLGFSPDSKQLAAGTHDSDVYVWSVPNGRMVHMLRGDRYGNRVYGVTYSPDGSMVAGGCYHGILEIWNARTGRLIRKTDTGHRCHGVAFSPDGAAIASVSDGLTRERPTQATGYADIWSLRSGRLRRTMNPENPGDQTDFANAVAYSRDGRMLAVGTQFTLRLWRLKDGKLIRNLAMNQDDRQSYETVAFSPNGRTLAAGGIDGSITIWDVRRFKKVKRLRHKGMVISLSYSPNGRMLAASVAEKNRNYVVLWHATTHDNK